MIEPVRIRLARPADAETIHTMLSQLAVAVGHDEAMVATPHDLFHYGFGPRPAFETLIADAGGKAVGLCLWFETFSTWRGRPGVYVQDLFVDQAARGMGLGRKLLAAAAQRGREIGANHLRLSVDHANNDAKAAYRSMGLAHVEEDHIFQIGGAPFDALAGGGPVIETAGD